jgi:hypothetical protein
MGLLTYLLFLVLVFALLAYILAIYMRRVMDSTLTDKFRAAEAISAGRIPRTWVAKIDRRMALRPAIYPWLRKRTGTELAIAKLDGLYPFFERIPYYENAEARDVLLTRLKETRARWATMTWDALRLESNEDERHGPP